MHLRRRHIGTDSLQQQLDRQIVQGLQLLLVCLGLGPSREQDLHPALSFQSPQHFQPVFLVTDLLQLLASRLSRQVFDHSLALGILVASLGLGVEFPSQPSHVPGGANQQRGVLKEPVIGDQAQCAGLYIRCPVQGVH